MRFLRLACAVAVPVSLVLGAAWAAPPEPDCGKNEFTYARSLRELPPDVQRALGVGETGFSAIVEPGQPFNQTDNLIWGLPGRRLRQAKMNSNCTILEIEQGGIALQVIRLTYVRTKAGWVRAATR